MVIFLDQLSSSLLQNMLTIMSLYFLRYIVMLLALSRIILTTEYCKICPKGSHTLCRYKEGPSDNCVEYKKSDFSSSMRRYIVDVHNDIRNHIASGQETRGALGRQPAASNMNSLQWDSELAEIAQRWADQCVGLQAKIQHDQCRKIDRFEVGQNILTALTPSLDIPDIAILILNWYKQVENVLPSDIETFSGIQRGKFLIGQYTQLVWADTRFVGCGMSTFRNNNNTAIKTKYLHRLVCNYGPRGNLIGSSVYSRGIPCSKCFYGKCDAVRSNLCQNVDKSYTGIKKHPTNSVPIHVDIPIPTHTLNLGYILKHNLTNFVNDITQKVNVHLHSGEDDKENFNFEKRPNLDQILAELALVMQHLNLTRLEKDMERTHRISPANMHNKFLRNALKTTSNILYNYDNYAKNLNREIYNLEKGEVIVHNCRQHLHQCQFEADELSTKTPITEDIVLPNNMIYKSFKGVWFHGRCRCNYVYRSGAHVAKYLHLTVTLCILYVHNKIN